jgi:heme exporter protein D
MDAWGWLAVALPLLVLAVAVWAIARQRRRYPPDRPRVGDEPERSRESRWVGWTWGGGRG